MNKIFFYKVFLGLMVYCTVIVCSKNFFEQNLLLGLSNLGNTCYMNALLQNLFNIIPLNDILLDSNNKPGGSMLPAYQAIVRSIVVQNSVNTTNLKNFYKEIDSVLENNYLKDLTGSLSELINEEAKFDKEIVNDFLNTKKEVFKKKGERYKIMVKFIDYLKENSNYNSDLGPELITTIEQLFQNFYKPTFRQQDSSEFYTIFIDTLLDRDVVTREFVEKVQAIVGFKSGNGISLFNLRIEKDSFVECIKDSFNFEKNNYGNIITKLPLFFVMAVARLDDRGQKNSKSIDVAYNVNMSHYVKDAGEYVLIGMTLHLGQSYGSGHYTAYVKSLLTKSFEWFYCDDNLITRIGSDDDLKKEHYKSGVNNLFYVKKEWLDDYLEKKSRESSLEKLSYSLQRIAVNELFS